MTNAFILFLSRKLEREREKTKEKCKKRRWSRQRKTQVNKKIQAVYIKEQENVVGVINVALNDVLF